MKNILLFALVCSERIKIQTRGPSVVGPVAIAVPREFSGRRDRGRLPPGAPGQDRS